MMDVIALYREEVAALKAELHHTQELREQDHAAMRRLEHDNQRLREALDWIARVRFSGSDAGTLTIIRKHAENELKRK
jgi:hypothetical protein